MNPCKHGNWSYYFMEYEVCGTCHRVLRDKDGKPFPEPQMSYYDVAILRKEPSMDGQLEHCQFCNQGPFTSEQERKVHEQIFCPMKPAPPEPVDVQGQSGHAFDEEAARTWKEQTGRETRLHFYTPDPNFQVSQRLQAKFKRLVERRQFSPQHIYLIGAAGTGKTSLALQFAAITKSPTYKAPCPAMTEVGQWMGRVEFRPDQGTVYVPSRFVEACETEGSVIILNDITRVENPKVLNPLMDILDDTAATYCEELGRTVRVAPKVVFFATANEGWEYTGADDPDVALKQRFEVLELSLPPSPIIQQIVLSKVADTQEIRAGIEFFLECIKRGIPLSLRHALRLAEDIQFGATLGDAAMLGMLGDIEADQRRDALQILQVKTGMTPEDLEVSDEWSIWDA